MLNIIIRVGDYVSWFLIPEAYNKKQFDALVNLPGANPLTHMGLWKGWVTRIGGKYSGPRTVNEFHGLDGRHVDIKVDGDRIYSFKAPSEKTIFYANGEWYEVFNFDDTKLPWLDWVMSEPGVVLGRRWDNFQKATGAERFRKRVLNGEPTTYVYQETPPSGFILSPGVR